MMSSFEVRQHLASMQIKDIMSNPVCIDPDATVQAAARLMCSGKRSCLPVVDTHEKLLGIITSHDLIGLLERIDPAALPMGVDAAPSLWESDKVEQPTSR